MSGLGVENLSVTRDGRSLLAAIGFSAPQGAITGIVGPNGAGKSTLLSAMLGLVARVEGRAVFEGRDVLAMPRRQRARLCAYVQQAHDSQERLAVADVVALGRLPFRPAWPGPAESAEAAIVGAALEAVGLAGFAARLYASLSGGERQRVHIARALAQEPRLLVLDEPTSALDIGAQLHILNLLRREARAGRTVVMALHDLNLALRYCDHLVVLNRGARVAEGPPAAILLPALVRDIYGVRARLVPDGQTGRTFILYDGV